ncbi:MAG: class I SAM-dependent methyltransferase [Lachnospiraceae bacterium]|nr:class I SAM-dependent methyltransferase [Lachnospiraceae bacterium]
MSEENNLQIGKVNLDLTYYPGEDRYCDGTIEDELLQITSGYAEVEYPRIIEERKQWEILYHLSSQRENIVEWLPIDRHMKVLEVGAGCGAITGALARKAGHVTSVDLSLKRSKINAYRHSELGNIEIRLGNFQDVEPSLDTDYDYICLIGVFEYAQAYIEEDPQSGETKFERFLNIMKKHLKADGRIVIAIENRFGLKYWAGCREDHLGTFFSGLEDYPQEGPVKTFTRAGLEKIFKRCDAGNYQFFYPYPDYKFMHTLYSDAYLPKQGELSDNMRNFDRDRMVLFDEKKVFDSIIRDGKFADFSNSYLVVLGPEVSTQYVKYSNDRQPEYQIRTEICAENRLGYQEQEVAEQGRSLLQRIVRKFPMSLQASEHIRAIGTAYTSLRDRYKDSDLKINRCHLVDVKEQIYDSKLADSVNVTEIKPYVELEYLDGVTLEELMDECLLHDDQDAFMTLLARYVELVDFHNEQPVADFDMIFANIILTVKDPYKPFDPLQNAVWNLIDYEWTFGKQMSTKELAFRAIYCYILEDKKREKLNLDRVVEALELTDEEMEGYREQELSFQRFVTGNHRSMTELRDLMRHECHDPQKLLQDVAEFKGRVGVQVYEDHGAGYREEESYFLKNVEEDGAGRSVELTFPADVSQIRIDPAMTCCIVTFQHISLNGQELILGGKHAQITTNGYPIGEQTYAFTTGDPNVNISFCNEEGRFVGNGDVTLEAAWEITELTEQMAKQIETAHQPKRRFFH